MDLQDLMNRAQSMQENLKHEIARLAVEGSSGGGAVKVVINGHKELTKIEFREDALDDAELLADMVLAALGQAYADVDGQMKQRLSNMMGGVDLSGLSDLLKS